MEDIKKTSRNRHLTKKIHFFSKSLLKFSALTLALSIIGSNTLFSRPLALDQESNNTSVTAKVEANSKTKLERQKALIEQTSSLKGFRKNIGELSSLSKNGLTLTETSLAELEENFKNQNYDTGVSQIDLFEDTNAQCALVAATQDYLNAFSDTSIEASALLKALLAIINEDMPANDKNAKILLKLDEIEKYSENFKEIKERQKSFFRFIANVKKIYQTSIARIAAAEILESMRTNAENAIDANNQSSEFQVNGSVPLNGLTIGLNAGINKSEGKSEKSFYKINVGHNVGISVGVNFLKFLEACIGLNLEVVQSTVFYSLEQFLYEGINNKSKSVLITSDNVKGLIDNHSAMYEKEKELLKNFQMHIENYLRLVNIIPASVYMTWPKVTKPTECDSEKSVNTSISADLKAFSVLGLSPQATVSNISMKRYHPLINLISKDCSPANNLSSSDILNFLNVTSPRYQAIKDLEADLKKRSDPNKTQEGFASLVASIKAEISRYNRALATIAEKNSAKEQMDEATKIVQNTEKLWVKCFDKNKMLSAVICVAVYLRDLAKTTEEIGLCKQLYLEIEHLSQMQIFSKDKEGKKASFNVKDKYKSTNISASAYVNIPYLTDAKIKMSYITTKDEPGYGDATDIDVEIKIPGIIGSVAGVPQIKNKLSEMIKSLEKNGHESSTDLKSALSYVKYELIKVLQTDGVKILDKALSENTILGYHSVVFKFTKILSNEYEVNPVALPDSNPILRDKDEWILKYYAIDKAGSVYALIPTDVVNLKYTQASHKISCTIGSDTLTFLKSRFNVFELGLRDRAANDTSINPLWISFKNGSKNEIKKILQNIADEESNSRYELQQMYDKLTEENDECIIEYTFKEFLQLCKDFSANPDNEKKFDQAFEYLTKILHLNYTYNFYPAYYKIA